MTMLRDGLAELKSAVDDLGTAVRRLEAEVRRLCAMRWPVLWLVAAIVVVLVIYSLILSRR